METIFIKSQEEWDNLESNYMNDTIEVIIQTKEKDNLVIKNTSNKRDVKIDNDCYVGEMRGSSQVGEMRESSQVGEMRGSSQVGVMRGSSQVGEMRGSSQVGEMRGSSQVGVMRGSSQVREMRENSQVRVMRGSSQVREMRENSQVRVMRENSQVRVMRENSQVRVMRESSQVGEMRGSSQVKKLLGYASILLMYSSSVVNSLGYNTIRYYDTETDIKIVKNINTTVIKLPTIAKKPTLDMYLKLYPIENKGKNLIFYKSVHKNKGIYYSDYNPNFKYEIGKTISEKIDKNKDNSCSKGIHISDKQRAISFGCNWDNMALLECIVEPKTIIVSKDCDGKVRTSKLKIIREVPKKERYI